MMSVRQIDMSGFSEGHNDAFQQALLFAFAHQQIVIALIRDLHGNLLLTSLGINAEQKVVDVKGFQKLRNGCDLIALLLNPILSEGNATIGGEGSDDIVRSSCPIGRITNRFAIYCNLPDPATKEGFELLTVVSTKQTVEGHRRYRTDLERQKPLRQDRRASTQNAKFLRYPCCEDRR